MKLLTCAALCGILTLGCGPSEVSIADEVPESVIDEAGELVAVTPLVLGTTVQVSGVGRSTNRFKVDLPVGTSNLTIAVSPASATLKLLARINSAPTLTTNDCLTTSGTCDVANPGLSVIIDLRETKAYGPVSLSTSAQNGPPPGPGGGVKGIDISPHTALGLPDSAGIGRDAQWLLVKPQYVVSYNTTRKNANYSAWKLVASDSGSAARTNAFASDSALSLAKQATLSDFVGSGYARGHICPSADRTDTTANNTATFLLTNMLPQTDQSNNGPWKDLETNERALAASGKTLFIVAGPIYEGPIQTIGNGVRVPSSMFKVIVVLNKGQGVSNVTTATQVIAAEIPNTTSVSGPWGNFKTSVDSIEAKTGLDLMSDVPVDVQRVLER
jgi:endonuclease G, mitochondrial